MTFAEFLMYMQGRGINAVLGVLESFAVEWWPQFKTFSDRKKRVVFLVATVGVPAVGALTSAAMGYQPWDLEVTFWPAISAGVLSFLGSQVAHLRKMA